MVIMKCQFNDCIYRKDEIVSVDIKMLKVASSIVLKALKNYQCKITNIRKESRFIIFHVEIVAINFQKFLNENTKNERWSNDTLILDEVQSFKAYKQIYAEQRKQQRRQLIGVREQCKYAIHYLCPPDIDMSIDEWKKETRPLHRVFYSMIELESFYTKLQYDYKKHIKREPVVIFSEGY